MIGTKLGHFEIQAKIGEGGMGAVYRAKDLALGRTVALKVLPPAMTAIPERKARFIREAKAASSLQHPNIVTILEIGAQDGVDYMAMELVEGKTLADLIPAGGMNAAEALRIARQMADGLAKAHAAKILHRDLKPSNVMVSADGHAKILDFGLAKLMQPDPISADDATVTHLKTEAGTIMGTFAYMSPEQAEGRTLDARSDIFSFGSMFYEMLTGRRAFQRATQTGTMAALLRDPVDMTGVPPHLADVVSRCLQKDLDRRFQSMAEVRAALLQAGDAPRKRAGLVKWLAPLAAAAVLALGAVAGLWWWQSPDRLPPIRVVPLTTDSGTESYPTFSPDGTQVAYMAVDSEKPAQRSQIFVKIVGRPTALQLTSHPDGAGFPAWSPDGKRIAFIRREGKVGLYVTSPLGGPEQRIATIPLTSSPSWSPDGTSLAVAALVPDGTADPQPSILLIPAEGGTAKTVLASAKGKWFTDPDFHPTQRTLAFLACDGLTIHPRCQIQMAGLNDDGSLRGETVQSITRPMRGDFTNSTPTPRWTADGKSLLFSFSSHLWRIGLPNQEPIRLEQAGVGAFAPAVSRRGHRVAYGHQLLNLDIWTMDSQGASRPLLASSLLDLAARFSPEGSRIAFATDRDGEQVGIWLAKADGSEPTPLLTGPGIFQASPVWSPDGQWLAFDSLDPVSSLYQIWLIESSGGAPRQLTNFPKGAQVPAWSHDGQNVYFNAETAGRFEIYRLPVKGGVAEQVTKAGGSTAQESADGKTLYFTTNSRVSSLYAMPTAGGPAPKIVDQVVERAFQVFEDGVYYLAQPTGQRELRFRRFADGRERVIGTVKGGMLGQYLSVSPDRKSFLFTHSPQVGADLMLMENFR